MRKYHKKLLLFQGLQLEQHFKYVSTFIIIVSFIECFYLHLAATPVDDPLPLDLDGGTDKKIYDEEVLRNKVSHSKYSVFIPTYNKTPEEKVS